MLTLMSQPRQQLEQRPIAYMEMPEEKTVMTANEIALSAARLLVEPQPQVLGHRVRALP